MEGRRATRRNAKQYLVWDHNLFRRRSKCVVLVPTVISREALLRQYHDKIGHWDGKAARRQITEMFWWPELYNEIHQYVKSCTQFQQMAPLPLPYDYETTGDYAVRHLLD